MVYSFQEHTADVKFIAEGRTLEELFSESANALKESIYGEMKVLEQTEKEITINATGFENLLYKFLEEFLVLLDSESFLLSTIKEISIDPEGFSLKAKASGDDAEKYHFTNDVKAVTYSQMEIKKTDSGFESVVVLDV